jgi:hypothetical protein
MRALKALLLGSFIVISTSMSAVWGIYKSGLSVNGGYYDCELNTASPEFQHSNFGSYSTGGTISLDFAEVLTFKGGSDNACSANLRYRVYRTCDAPGSFQTLSLPYCCDFGGTNCTGGACGPDVSSTGDQKWRGTSSVNLMNGLTLPGVYVIEVYFDATGQTGSTSGCAETDFSSNSSNNYRAYFSLNMNETFTDGNFTAAPVWSGDAANITVLNNSNTSGLVGTEQTRTHTLKSNTGSGAGSQYLSTPITTWDAQQEWYFWIGRDGGSAATLNNQIHFWLYSTDANLEGVASTNDGYRIVYGDNSGGDNLILESVTDGTGTVVITSTNSTANGLVDYGIAVRVTRSQLGVWNLYTSYLPQTAPETQATPTPLSCVEASATILQGTATNTLYTPGGTGYVGPVFIHSSGSGERQSPEFDNLRFVPLPPNTEVKITGLTSGTANEDVANTGNLAIDIQLSNPSATVATTIDLVLTSGTAARVGRGTAINTNYAGPYTTITLTWPAATSGVQTVYIDPDDNNLCDDIANLVFTLQNPTGGNGAYVGSPAAFTAAIIDDNTGYETLLSDNFESGNLTSWTTTGTAWSASTGAPINGTYSARHSTQAGSGTSSIVYPFDDVALPGVTTTWRFHVKYLNDPSSNNNFQVFLAGSEANLNSATVDGYAVVLDQASLPSAGTNDYIRLYRVDNGAYASTPIINSTTDWDTNVNSGTKVALEVILSETGVWTINIDITGDFDNLVTLPGATSGNSFMDNHPTNAGGLTYPVMKNFGVRYKYTAGVSDFIRFDDVSVIQKGCKEIWYSQSSGNVNASIWGNAPVSTAQTVTGGRYKRFVVQGSATGDNVADNVTTNIDWTVNDLSIDAGGTLTGGSATTKVYGNWVNAGTFTWGTSNVHFKGQAAQSILGSASTTFYNLTIDNDGSNVTVATAANVRGRVFPEEGTLQTGGILTLVSNAAGTSSIGEIKSGASVSGNVTLQRYIANVGGLPYGDWVNLGCPILGQTIADWNDDIITTGFTGSDYPAPYPFINIRSYTESTAGGLNLGYVNATNVTNAISGSGNTGFFVWLQSAAQNIDNTGAIQTGTFNNALSYTVTGGGILNDGWNLMTNPYPSEVDWNQVTSTFSVSNPRVYYVYDYETKAYKNYNASNGLGLASRYLPHSQSFLVKVNTVGQNLTYQESYKTNVGTNFERSNITENQFVAFKLSRNGFSDESILSFDNNATNGFDGLDAFDLESPTAEAVELSLMSEDNVPLATDSRPLNADLSVPVYLDMPEAGTYIFSIEEIQNLPLGTCLLVEDLITGTVIHLEAGEQMSIITNTPYQGNRLVIHATAPVSVLTSEASCFGSADGSIDVTVPTGNWSVVLEDLAGNNEYISSGSATFDHLAAGTYTLQVSASEACTASEQTIVITEPAPALVSIADVRAPQCNVGEDGAIEFNVENEEWFSYELRNTKNQVVASSEVDGQTGIIENLKSGNYTLHVYTNCTNFSEEVIISDPQSVSLTMDITPQTIVMENGAATAVLSAYTNQGEITWTCSNGQSGTGEIFMPQFAVEGEYTIAVSAVSGVCSSTQTVQVSVKSAEVIAETGVQFLQLNNEVQLTFGTAIDADKVTIELFDATGRITFSKDLASPASQLTIIGLGDLADGVYTVRVSADGKSLFNRKFVK